ncbi:helix-hairpin-helix domain-containing protein [Holzapfeliella sp. JNUCC 72]
MEQVKKHRTKLIMIAVAIIFVGGLLIYSLNPKMNKQSFESETSGFIRINNLEKSDNVSEESHESQPETIKVDISGEIKMPGVYELNRDSRIHDLIKLAGGVTESANLNATNQSRVLKDQDKIIIKSMTSANSETLETGDNKTQDGEKESGKIDLNTATESELQGITGIGQKKAQRIIDYRKKHGNFSSVDDLKNVTGIGDKFIESIRADVKV